MDDQIQISVKHCENQEDTKIPNLQDKKREFLNSCVHITDYVQIMED